MFDFIFKVYNYIPLRLIFDNKSPKLMRKLPIYKGKICNRFKIKGDYNFYIIIYK